MRKRIQLVLICSLLACTACFPTFQTARIDPGFRLEMSAILLDDKPRHGTPQGSDFIAMVSPSYAWRHVEIGVPIGFYAEEGLFSSGIPRSDKNSMLVMPYLKFGLLPFESPNHLALIAQSAFILPANVGVRVGRDLGSWEPHVGMNYIFSGGEAGDDPTITRYQERNQTMMSFSAGATFKRWRNTAFEIGMLRNQYEDVTLMTPGGTVEYGMFRYYDAYAGVRFNLVAPRR